MPWELRAKKIKAHLVGTIFSPGNHEPNMSGLQISCMQEPWSGALEFALAVPALEEKAMALCVLELCPLRKTNPSIRIQGQKFLVPGSDTIDSPPKGAPGG